jgi:hypothetical protein
MNKYEVHLQRIEYDYKLPLFLMHAREKLDTKFQVVKGNVTFQFSLGMKKDLERWNSYTDIHFEIDFDANFGIFEQEVPLFINYGLVKIESPEGLKLKNLKNKERANIESQLINLFPLVLEAYNTFRRAFRIALYEESVAGLILVQNIQDRQRHLGLKLDHSLNDDFSRDDTEFIFSAFCNLSYCSFACEAVIEYNVRSTSGQIVSGVFQDLNKGIPSLNRFKEKIDVIQELIDNECSIKTEVLLASLEFLYSDNYRMAIFNAATILENELNEFWKIKKQQLLLGSILERKKVESFEHSMKSKKMKYKAKVEKIIRIVLPDYVEQDLVNDGTLDRCVDAWYIRNDTLAHLNKNIPLTSIDAWSAVSSIIHLIDALEKI